VPEDKLLRSRRNALKCMPMAEPGRYSLYPAASLRRSIWRRHRRTGRGAIRQAAVRPDKRYPLGLQQGRKPDVNGTLAQAIDLVNGMDEQPALIIHTGDITHLSKAAEFDLAQQLFSRLRTTEMHTVPANTTPPMRR